MAKPPKLDQTRAARTINDLEVIGLGVEDVSEEDAINLLMVLDDLYFNGQTVEGLDVSDDVYDVWKRFWENSFPDNAYFDDEMVGSDVRGGKVKLPYTMGSLTQAYEGDTIKFFTKYNVSEFADVVISDKLDGQSGMVVYRNGKFSIGYSRGNGFQGADLSRHMRRIPSIPQTIDHTLCGEELTVRGELIISVANYEFLKTRIKTRSGGQYKNPRAMIAGLMNASSNDPIVYDYIDFVAYSIVKTTNGLERFGKLDQLNKLRHFGFKIVYHWVEDAGDMTDDHMTMKLNERRANSEYELDGVVYEVESAEYRSQISPTNGTLNPEYARKYKVASEDNVAEPIVANIMWEPSKHGYLIPRINIEPTELRGVTVTMATGFNAQFIFENQIGPGARIRITRSGDVIPFVTDVIAPAPIDNYHEWFQSELNKFGEWVWNDSGVSAILVSDHPDILIKQTAAFFTTIEAAHIGEGTVRELSAAGLKTPIDIIGADRDTLGRILGENGYKVYDSLVKRLSNVRESVLIAATGMCGRGIGRRKLAAAMEYVGCDLDQLANRDLLLTAPSFQHKTVQKIVSGVPLYKSWKDQAIAACTYLGIIRDDTPYGSGPLDGMVFVFTGFRSPDLKERIQQNGGVVLDSYSKKVTHVVAVDPSSTSTKLKKAAADGAVIMSPDMVESMI